MDHTITIGEESVLIEKTEASNANDVSQDNFKLALDTTMKQNTEINDSYRNEPLVPKIYDSNEESKSGDASETPNKRYADLMTEAENIEKALVSGGKEMQNIESVSFSKNLHNMCSTFNSDAVVESNSQV